MEINLNEALIFVFIIYNLFCDLVVNLPALANGNVYICQCPRSGGHLKTSLSKEDTDSLLCEYWCTLIDQNVHSRRFQMKQITV